MLKRATWPPSLTTRLPPVQAGWLTTLLGGYRTAKLLHFALALGDVGFIGLHLVQVARAGWGNLRSMVTGDEEVLR